ncbi:hypothetical protein LQF67_04350 [Tetragenococcus halophilus]|uniref:hypothetical protein n=1 Tax=Tetragenococcus halophilus TaxID=51669 RepID=UPI001F3C502D|nr:hypothetical protein [Tetragenococcus halophilus]MCF1684813.1 hypothetical protein [Tetragenococcus halophilus]
MFSCVFFIIYNVLLSISDDVAKQSMVDKLNESGITYQVYNVNNYDRFKELKEQNVPVVETDDLNPEDIE